MGCWTRCSCTSCRCIGERLRAERKARCSARGRVTQPGGALPSLLEEHPRGRRGQGARGRGVGQYWCPTAANGGPRRADRLHDRAPRAPHRPHKSGDRASVSQYDSPGCLNPVQDLSNRHFRCDTTSLLIEGSRRTGDPWYPLKPVILRCVWHDDGMKEPAQEPPSRAVEAPTNRQEEAPDRKPRHDRGPAWQEHHRRAKAEMYRKGKQRNRPRGSSAGRGRPQVRTGG